MLIADLVAVVQGLPAAQPLTDAFEAREPMGGAGRPGVSYRNQKEHLLGWLSEYGGPGAYGRKHGSDDPRAAYNRFQCARGLIWLAEALGEDRDVVRKAIAAVEAAPPRGASQCKAVRGVIPWIRIEELAEARAGRGVRAGGVTAAHPGRRALSRAPRVAGRRRRPV